MLAITTQDKSHYRTYYAYVTNSQLSPYGSAHHISLIGLAAYSELHGI